MCGCVYVCVLCVCVCPHTEGKLKPAPYRKHSITSRKASPAKPDDEDSSSGLKAGLIVNAMHTHGSPPGSPGADGADDIEQANANEEGNACCSDGNWYDIDNIHRNSPKKQSSKQRLHASTQNARRDPKDRESIYSDDEDDDDDDLFDDYDEDEVREEEVNAILEERAAPPSTGRHSWDITHMSAHSSSSSDATNANTQATTNRLSFGFPSFSLSTSHPQQQQQQQQNNQQQNLSLIDPNESTAIEVSLLSRKYNSSGI
jgi:hypothetical protein